jgi:hypothetical protein
MDMVRFLGMAYTGLWRVVLFALEARLGLQPETDLIDEFSKSLPVE